METTPFEPVAETDPDWKSIVEAVWALAYVSDSLRGVAPRLAGLEASINALEEALPSSPEAAAVLEKELKAALAYWAQALGSLSAQSERLSILLERVERLRGAADPPRRGG